MFQIISRKDKIMLRKRFGLIKKDYKENKWYHVDKRHYNNGRYYKYELDTRTSYSDSFLIGYGCEIFGIRRKKMRRKIQKEFRKFCDFICLDSNIDHVLSNILDIILLRYFTRDEMGYIHEIIRQTEGHQIGANGSQCVSGYKLNMNNPFASLYIKYINSKKHTCEKKHHCNECGRIFEYKVDDCIYRLEHTIQNVFPIKYKLAETIPMDIIEIIQGFIISNDDLWEISHYGDISPSNCYLCGDCEYCKCQCTGTDVEEHNDPDWDYEDLVCCFCHGRVCTC